MVSEKSASVPKISLVLQDLEGFTVTTALDLYMGYCIIRLVPKASKISSIFSIGKVLLPMTTNGHRSFSKFVQAKISQ